MPIHFGSRVYRLPAAVCTAVLVGLLAACAGRDVTAPADRSPGHRTDLVPADGGGGGLPVPNASWSSFFAPPPNSSPGAVSATPQVDFGSVPDSTWVVVNVNGTIQQVSNPECAYAPPYWPCQGGSVVSDFEYVPGEVGPVRLWANGGIVKLRGVGGTNGSSGIGLHYMASAGSFTGKVNAQPKWAWNPTTGTGPYSYNLSGGYDVSVMAVPNPVGISDSGPLDSLGTRRYSVQPLYGLQYINPLDWSWTWPAGAISWYFIPGDSVGPNPGFTGQFIEVSQCHFQQTCEYTPPGPGRMQATSYVETKYVVVRSANVCELPPSSDGVDDEDWAVPANCGPLTRRCPKVLGKVITAGIRVAGTLHTFKFEGPFTRSSATSVPATYPIRPTVSEDGMWIAESGSVTVYCYGFYIPIRSGVRVFVGTASYASSDLHMVMGPSHPDF